jgi:hypothetical protein
VDGILWVGFAVVDIKGALVSDLVIPGSIQGIVWAVDTGAGVVCLICVC